MYNQVLGVIKWSGVGITYHSKKFQDDRRRNDNIVGRRYDRKAMFASTLGFQRSEKGIKHVP